MWTEQDPAAATLAPKLAREDALLDFAEPAEVACYRIALASTSNLFRHGHRIRLEVSSSNFPRFDRNLNTGEAIATGTRVEVARQTVLHSGAYPSHLLLPLIPAGDAP